MPNNVQTRDPDEVQPDPFGVIGVVAITVLWALALLVCLVLQFATTGNDYTSQVLVCGAGLITGVLLSWFFIARRKRHLRRSGVS